jgi:phosphatidate cytidylyltransferase
MHLRRWITALVGLSLLFFLVGPGPRWLLHSFILFLAIAGLIEFYRLTAPRIPNFVRILSYLVTSSLFIAFYLRQINLAPFIILMWTFFPLIFYLFSHPTPDRQWTDDIGKTALGPIYIGLPLSMLVCIDFYPKGDGKMWIFFLLVVIFASDTGAYYAGRYLGKHKLYEAISPNKTWEGAIGGLLLSLILSNLFLRIFPFQPLNAGIIILVFVLAITGQIGDLVESMLKRNHGAKDSGGILPGHGGILDRIDGLLFAIPVLYVYLYGLML